jgi:hypothetical protein
MVGNRVGYGLMSVLCLSALVGSASAQTPSTNAFSGFSIHRSDAEAGLTPVQPRTDDTKVLTDDGHAYWLRNEPLLADGINGVRIEPGRGGGYLVWVHLTLSGRTAMQTASRLNDLQAFAYVLNGHMVGRVVTINGVLDGTELAITVFNETDASELEKRIKRYLSTRH